MARHSAKEDRLFVKQPFRHYRRTYSLVEVRYGFLVLAVLVGVGGWVYWKGNNPDPELFATGPLTGGDGSTQVVFNGKAPAKSTGAASATHGAKGADKRGPLPAGLASAGWVEGEISSFDKSTLYEKINGRADFFHSFGFKMLYFAALRKSDDETATVDIETYDLGTPANALGAFSGERKASDKPRVAGGGMAFMGRNALFMTRGKYYIRAIGSSEDEIIKAQLRHLEKVLVDGVQGASALPWAYELFVKQLSIEAGDVKYQPTTALSFEFGRDVYTARSGDGPQLFVVVKANEAEAKAMAGKFVEGFASYGKKVAGEQVPWVKDTDTGDLSTAVHSDRFVLGVRGAADLAAAKAALAKLMLGLSEMNAEAKKRARPAKIGTPGTGEPDGSPPHPNPPPGGGGSEGAEPGGGTTEGAEPGGGTTEGAEPGGGTTEGAEPGGGTTEGGEPGGTEPGYNEEGM